MNDKQLDKYIKDNLKAMIDGPVPVDMEKSWETFQQRLENEKRRERSSLKQLLKLKRFSYVAAVVAVALIVASASVPKEVQAFKDKIFQWLSVSEGEEYTILTDKVNPEIEPGFYENLSLEEAQSLTIYQIKFPNYLPENLEKTPHINVNVGKYPHSVTDLQFIGDDSFLSLRQENLIGENSFNTYVPNNLEVEKINLFNNQAEGIVIKKENNYQIIWTINSIKYTLTSKNIPFQELLKIIDSL
ncbi:MAG: DUF4367 domain-containing protein [Thermoanaerobacteraceae bacterium]|nr:DUF4367 domain-containing protein [Thermoanaerobacteraceae bacterium]